MNILLTSVGRRSYLVKYFKKALGKNGQVHVANSSPMTPAFSYADMSTVTPLIYDDNYIPFLMDYCIQHKINAIISLFDVDLFILASNKKLFEKNGVQVCISDKNVINTCNDKWETYNFLINNEFNVPKTYITLKHAIEAINIKEITFPIIIKPRWGMGSIGIFEAENQEELEILYKKVISNIKDSYLKYESNKNLEKSVIIQQKLCGQEYGLDVINDLSGKYCNTIPKIKYAMRSGETDCAEVVESRLLKRLGEQLGEKLKHVGNLDVDVFVYNQKAYVLEMNARFGGGYPFSHMAGVNLPKAIVHWLNNENIDLDLLKEKVGVRSCKDINLVRLCDFREE